MYKEESGLHFLGRKGRRASLKRYLGKDRLDSVYGRRRDCARGYLGKIEHSKPRKRDRRHHEENVLSIFK